MRVYLTSFSFSSKHGTALCPMVLPQPNICTTQTSTQTHSNTKLFIKIRRMCKKRGHTNFPRLETPYELKYLPLNQRMRVYLTSFSFSSKHGTALCSMVLPQQTPVPRKLQLKLIEIQNSLLRCTKRVKSEGAQIYNDLKHLTN